MLLRIKTVTESIEGMGIVIKGRPDLRVEKSCLIMIEILSCLATIRIGNLVYFARNLFKPKIRRR